MPRPALTAAVALLVLSALITPMQRDLFVGDETKYGQVVREMRATGAFFLPTLNGTPFTHKPPLHFWLIDLLTLPLGVYSMWAFTLPSLGAFVFLLWLMWRMGGPLAAFVCGSSLMIWTSAQSARMDVSFTAFIVLALWQIERFFERDDFRALFWCGVSLGVAILIKGPMAPVIPIVLFFLEWLRRGRVPRGNYAPALLAMIAIPLLWFIPAMLLGGRAYTQEVIVKQTVGRAIASWVHNAPPWFYAAHLPATLFPWFFLAAVAVVALRRTHRFLINWIIAVVVPYSVISSKLDVYMMAMIPPVALLIAEHVSTERPERRRPAGWTAAGPAARIANLLAIALMAALGIAGLFVSPRQLRGPEAALVQLPAVKLFCMVTAVVAIISFVIALRASLMTSTIVAGLVPIASMVVIAIVLMPVVNELVSTRPLVAALQKQRMPPEQIALYAAPYLWTRDFPRELERVVYANPETLIRTRPAVIVTARAHAGEIAPSLAGYRVVDSVRMIGKWFDVYRR
ncbi:MAG: glycosyltransferase family 39 protein [Acidobacteriota bacterium]|nr:glycosyltransferase family 39 protein [Acidobacteriota bacterium]